VDLLDIIQQGTIKDLKEFIASGSNVHVNNDYALRHACYLGRTEIVKKLIEYNADIHVNDDFAFRIACYYNRLEVVKLLVEHGANLFPEDSYGLLNIIDVKRNDSTYIPLIEFLDKQYMLDKLKELV
jgi:ankyrin repeat protein